MFLGCVLRMKQTLVDAVAREGYSAVMRRIPLVTHFHWSERGGTGAFRVFGIAAAHFLRSGHLCTFFILRGETWDYALFYFWGLTL